MKVPLLDLKAQYAPIRDDIRAAIDEVCDAQYFILGGKVSALEEKIAAYCGTSGAIGVTSGSDALLIALMAMDVGPGDAVITTPYTFFATVGSIVRLGATPVFADIDPVSYNIDPGSVRALLENWPARFKESRPKVLLPVHLYGQCADMAPLLDLASEHGLKVVEDAAQAIGSEYPHEGSARKAGAMGDVGCFSFFPSKNLGGFGDGGMVTTNDPALEEKIKMLRNHGSSPKYYHGLVGGNFRLDAIQAAVLDVKLQHLETWHEARRKNARRYNEAFAGSPIVAPQAAYEDAGVRNYHIYNQYIVRVPQRDAMREGLLSRNVGCEIYYPLPLHMQECFETLGYQKGEFPESEKAAAETLALPIYPELTDEMQDYVADSLCELVAAGV